MFSPYQEKVKSRGTCTPLGKRVRLDNAYIPFKKEDIEQSIPGRFRQQIAAYPDRVAVKVGGLCLTYTALDRTANRIAQAMLEARGQQQETVAFLLGNGIPSVTAILGILKAGKIYVPLDPLFPVQRIAYMLADAQANLILTDNRNLALAEAVCGSGCRLLNIDEIDPHASDEDPHLPISPDAPAYIIYTSGSTGQPKGIVHNHRNILQCIRHYTNAFHIGPHDRLTQLHSCSFSSSMMDIFWTLLNGATLYPWDVKTEGLAGIAGWMARERITCLSWIPTPFRHFVKTLFGQETFPALRLLVLASEPVTRREVELFKKHCPPMCLLVNRLGSTETYNFRLYFIDKETRIEGHTVPAGYEVEDKEVLLLNEARQEVDPGQVGEIAVRSQYLALGYWRNPGLTAQAFLPDPEGGAKRIYLTGDLGRMHPDGCLEYLGRKDFQVKIRGQRIETAEIEAALLNLDGVQEVVVVAQEDRSDDQRLVAYLVADQAISFVPDRLRILLAEQLPHYMIPSAFVTLPALPMTPTGKVDRRALPSPHNLDTRSAHSAVAPRTPTEKVMVGLWRSLLKIDQVGIHDSFFELGGNSLLAANLFDQIERLFHQRLPLSTLMQAPTVFQLSTLLDAGTPSALWSSLVSIQPQGSRPPFFFVHAHGGNVIGYYDLARRLGPDQPFYGLQAQGLDGAPVAERRLEEMASHYIREIRTVQSEGPYFLGGWCMGGLLAYEMAQQLHASGADVALLVMVQASHPVYLRSRPGATGPGGLIIRIWMRLDLELSRFSESDSKLSYLIARINRMGTLVRVKGERLVWPFLARLGFSIPHSRSYAQEALGWMHSRAFRKYVPRPYFGRVTILRSEKQLGRIDTDPTLGWADLIRGDLDLYEIPGHDIGMISEPRVRIVAERVSACLNRTQPGQRIGQD